MNTALLVLAAPCCYYQRGPPVLLSSSTSTCQSCLYERVSPLGISFISPWSSLKRIGFVFPRIHIHSEKKRRSRRMSAYSSLFGVGAPEALVIGAVALLVFGPKGLAEIARNLGKTLRSFQPTIRELQEVSREFKSTFEREIGLDEVTSSAKNSYMSNTSAKESQQEISSGLNGKPTPEPSEGLVKITESQVDATTKSQAKSGEEQPQASTTSETAATISAPLEETAAAAQETGAPITPPAAMENKEGMK